MRFSPGFPLGGFSAEQFAPAWWKETAGGEERLLGRTSTALRRRVFWRELLRRYSDFAEKGISQRANCLVFALDVFKTGFFAPAVFY
jgi:hypothetical protein